MCRVSLNFQFYYDDNNDFWDIKTQLTTLRRELRNNLNSDKSFKYCEIHKCSIGQAGFCSKYHFNYFTKVYVFTVYWSVQYPHYRLRTTSLEN